MATNLVTGKCEFCGHVGDDILDIIDAPNDDMMAPQDGPSDITFTGKVCTDCALGEDWI